MSRPDPIHPGEILEEEFMKPLGLSANALAHALDVPVTRVSEIVRGRRGITADTALRLARLLGTTPEFWLGLQSDFDLRVARRDSGQAIGEAVSPLRGKRVVDRLEVRETGARYGPTSAHGLDRRRRRKAIRALEDRVDLQKAKKALKEKGSVPWKKVKADLGL